MTSFSNNILQNGLDEASEVSAAVPKQTIVDPPIIPICNRMSSMVSLDDFQEVGNKNKNKFKRKIMRKNVYIIKQVFHCLFTTGKITPNHIKEGLTGHAIENFKTEINIFNCRLSTRSSNNEYDFLIFLKDASSFSFLLDLKHWPSNFRNENFTFSSSPAIPSQLSLIIKNVDLRLDFNEFCQEIKTRYPQVKNVIRLKNKFNNDIKLVKLELTSNVVRDELLIKRKMTIDYIIYDIDEYLAPGNILICWETNSCSQDSYSSDSCARILAR
ncbi:unnamed protein product [Rotaria magnacalcarata]|uniref:Uncharacterized protein n=1 Tax=Rotaria magnacalcarata TaxID=392030 RepID=A0A816L7H5_9BILA|nr:unnamed protein product [Rotaria magnacalcarata]CAF4164284.1 unnamed protein product [Rotaria magnacalcarata]